MSAHPPRWFERLLRRSGRGTMMGEAAADDLRREWNEWRASRPRWQADLRYRREAARIALGLTFADVRIGPLVGAPRPAPLRLLASAARDVRYGLRGLARAPLFAAVAAGTLALGVGATVAIYTAVRAVILDPLPYPDSGELHAIEINTGGDGWYGASVPEFLDFERELHGVAEVAAYSAGSVTMGDSLSPVRVRAVFASAALLPMLGVRPAFGRFFTAQEETPGDNRYVLLSDALWRDAYGADPALVGRTVPLFGQAYVVLGIMPPSFAFPDPDTRAWFPFGINRQSPNPRNNHFLRVLIRLSGEPPPRVSARLHAYAVRAHAEYPEIYSERGFRVRMRTLHETVVGEVRTPLLFLMASVALVLVVACLNIVNLCVSRTEARRRELAVRAAVGASRARLTRQLLAESLLLGLVGGMGGVVLAAIAARAVNRFAPASLPRVDAIQLGPGALLLALVISMAAAAAFAVVPAMRVLAPEGRHPLAGMGRGVIARRSGKRLRQVLLTSQVALASVVAVGAGLMMRTLQNLRQVDPGFDPAGAVTLSVSPSFVRYPAPEQRAALWRELTTRIGAIPGVIAAGGTSALPLSDLYDNLSIRVEGRVTTTFGDAPDGRVQRVTPGLFEAMGIRLLEGRTFTDADRADAPPVVVVGETFAKRFWPGEDAVGKTMRVFADGYPWMEVVGVVTDLAHDRLDVAPEAMWYVPHAQAQNAYGTPLQLFAVVRADGPPAALVPRIRTALAAIDPTIAVSEVRLLGNLLEESLAVRGFTFALLRVFGLVALVLVCIGVYGVATLTVAERTSEIGLRKTLGAHRGAIVGLVARETLPTVALGSLVGLGGSLAATRLIESLLYGVAASDARTLLGTVLVLAAMAVAAMMPPTLRALRIEPLRAMRTGE